MSMMMELCVKRMINLYINYKYIFFHYEKDSKATIKSTYYCVLDINFKIVHPKINNTPFQHNRKLLV